MSRPTMHCAAAERRAVNNLVSYFGARAGSKAFQSPLKGIVSKTLGRDKREVPRRPYTPNRPGALPNLLAVPPCQRPRTLRAVGSGPRGEREGVSSTKPG